MNEFIEVPANKRSLFTRKLVHGIGVNDANYKIEYTTKENKKILCPYYKVWLGMLTRCYSAKFLVKHPTYKECTVCSSWLVFSNFRTWMEQQDYEGKCLDKDLLVKGNKTYSPSTCIFVTNAINNLLTNCRFGSISTGACWDKQRGMFLSSCRVESKNIRIGFFLTEKEASAAYIVFKQQHIISIANQQTDIRLKDALLRIANTL